MTLRMTFTAYLVAVHVLLFGCATLLRIQDAQTLMKRIFRRR